MTTHFLLDANNYNMTDDINSFECLSELEALRDDDYCKAIPYKHDHMEKLALAMAVLTGFELMGRVAEYPMHKMQITTKVFHVFIGWNRFLTFLSRFIVGIFVFGFVMANELLTCQPYHIDGYFKPMIGFLLSSYFTSVLCNMSIGHGNHLIFAQGGKEHAITIGADNFASEENDQDYSNPLLT